MSRKVRFSFMSAAGILLAVLMLAGVACSASAPAMTEEQVLNVMKNNPDVLRAIMEGEDLDEYDNDARNFEAKGYSRDMLLKGLGWIELTLTDKTTNVTLGRGGGYVYVSDKYVFATPAVLPPSTLEELQARGNFSVKLYRVAAVANENGRRYAPDKSSAEILPFGPSGVLTLFGKDALAVFERMGKTLDFPEIKNGSLGKLKWDDLVFIAGDFVQLPGVALENNVSAMRAHALSIHEMRNGPVIAIIESASPNQEERSTSDGGVAFALRDGEPEAVGIVVLSRSQENSARTTLVDLRFLLESLEKGIQRAPGDYTPVVIDLYPQPPTP